MPLILVSAHVPGYPVTFGQHEWVFTVKKKVCKYLHYCIKIVSPG